MDRGRLASATARGPKAKALRLAAQKFKAGDLKAFYRTLAVATVCESPLSATLSSPGEPNCPLVSCSDTFLSLSGYSREEIIGKNMRHISRGCTITAELRHRMRIAVRTGSLFSATVQNRRKNGDVFQNHLYLTGVRVGTEAFLLGIQHDVTKPGGEVSEQAMADEVRGILDGIFATVINAWAMVQVMHRSIGKLGMTRYVEDILQPVSDPAAFAQARDTFVSTGDLLQDRLTSKNTFLEVCDCEDYIFVMGLRRIFSEPSLETRKAAEVAEDGVPALHRRNNFFPSATCELPTMAAEHELGYSPTNSPAKSGTAANDRKSQGDLDAGDKPGASHTGDGSAGHPDKCTPCAFHCYSTIPCCRGEACRYCHMDHPRRRRPRGRQHKKDKAEREARAQGPDEDEDSGAEGADKATAAAPTPDALTPLLDALQYLSPLPIPTQANGSKSTQRRPSSGEEEAEDGRKQLTFEYSDSTIIVAVGQCKQILPFVGGCSDGLASFFVFPQLPRGLSLDTTSGVIRGTAQEATPEDGRIHTVVMRVGAGRSAETYIYVRVLGSPNGAAVQA